jgi:hypothetical protein
VLQGPSVEVLHRHALQVNSFKTANIDGGHPIALGIGSFSVGVNATRWAKAMLDNVLVERVRADIFVRRKHAQLVAWHKPQERSLARTHGTIASHRAIEITFHFECYSAAVTATLVLHVSSLIFECLIYL